MSPDSLKFPALAHAETRVGVILPLSGPSAILGEDCQRGIESAERSRGAIELIYADSKGDGKGGVTEFQRLVRQERVDAVLTTRSNTVLPMNPLSKQLKIPLLASIAPSSFTNDNPFSFQFWPTTEQEGRYLAQRLKQDGVRRLAIITAEDDWLVQNSSELRKAFSSPQSGDINPRSLKLDQSYNIVMNELLPTAEQDLLPIMLRL